jgi:mevalonate kinase
MTTPMVRIHDTETDKVTDRVMNAAELAQYEIDQAASSEKQSELALKAAEKASLLKRLGLTEDELKTILG